MLLQLTPFRIYGIIAASEERRAVRLELDKRMGAILRGALLLDGCAPIRLEDDTRSSEVQALIDEADPMRADNN